MSVDLMGWLELVLPFADTACPVGGYAHSYGLEGMVQAGAVRDGDGLRGFLLREVRQTLLRVDLPVMVGAHGAAVAGDGGEVGRLDEVARAMRPTREAREAGAKVGRAQWRLFERTWPELGGGDWRGEFVDFQVPVVAGVVFGLRGVPEEAGMRVLSYQACSGVVQAALKLLPVGPMEGQEILREALGEIGRGLAGVGVLEEEKWGVFSPEWDVACARHERAEARLFLS